MKKLLLVLPQSNLVYWESMLAQEGKTGAVRLSLPTIAALTPTHWDIEIVDARVTPVDVTQQVDLVGITAMTAEIQSAYTIADGFRKNGVAVVMGGVHVSALPEEALQHVDSVVIGEAETQWQQLLQDFEQGNLKSIYRANRLIDMTGMVIPRRDLQKQNQYAPFLNTIQATRGCPRNCEFCSVSAFFGRQFRTRPITEVIKEIQTFDTRYFFFIDDNIIGRPAYAKELFRTLIPLQRRWIGLATIELARDEELLSLYAESGGKYVLIGFDSLSEDNLQHMNKAWNSPHAYEEAIQKIYAAGIKIIGTFIFGFDADDSSVFQRTVDFIITNTLDAAILYILTPYPGTRLYTTMKQEGRIIEGDWSKYNAGTVVFTPKNMTIDALQQGYEWACSQILDLPMQKKFLSYLA